LPRAGPQGAPNPPDNNRPAAGAPGGPHTRTCRISRGLVVALATAQKAWQGQYCRAIIKDRGATLSKQWLIVRRLWSNVIPIFGAALLMLFRACGLRPWPLITSYLRTKTKGCCSHSDKARFKVMGAVLAPVCQELAMFSCPRSDFLGPAGRTSHVTPQLRPQFGTSSWGFMQADSGKIVGIYSDFGRALT